MLAPDEDEGRGVYDVLRAPDGHAARHEGVPGAGRADGSGDGAQDGDDLMAFGYAWVSSVSGRYQFSARRMHGGERTAKGRDSCKLLVVDTLCAPVSSLAHGVKGVV